MQDPNGALGYFLDPAAVAPPQRPLPELGPTPQLQAASVPPQLLQAIIGRALSMPQGGQMTPDDRSSALIKLGAALGATRQQGQSVLGQITNAASTTDDFVTSAKARNRKEAMDDATLASALATQDTQRRGAEFNMEVAQAKYPAEMQQLQLNIQALRDAGDVSALTALKARMTSNPEKVLQDIRNDEELKRKQIELVGAQGDQARGAAAKSYADAAGERQKIEDKVYEAMANYYNKNVPDRSQVHISTMADGTAIISRNTPKGAEYSLYVPGMDAKAALAAAKKELNKDTWPWNRVPDTDQRVIDRATELQKPKFKSLTAGDVTPGAVGNAPPLANPPKGTAAERKMGAQIGNLVPESRAEVEQSIAELTQQIAGEKDPKKKAVYQQTLVQEQQKLADMPEAGTQSVASTVPAATPPAATPGKPVVVTPDMLAARRAQLSQGSAVPATTPVTAASAQPAMVDLLRYRPTAPKRGSPGSPDYEAYKAMDAQQRVAYLRQKALEAAAGTQP